MEIVAPILLLILLAPRTLHSLHWMGVPWSLSWKTTLAMCAALYLLIPPIIDRLSHSVFLIPILILCLILGFLAAHRLRQRVRWWGR